MNGLPPGVLEYLMMQGRPMPQAESMPQVDMNTLVPPPIPQLSTPAVGGAIAQIPAPPVGAPTMPDIPIAPGIPGGPPAAPQGGMWQQFASDPANLMGLLTFGLNMMQPVQPGQSSLGHAAQSIGQGVSTAGQQKELVRKRGIEEKKEAREEKRLGLEEQRVGLEGRRVTEAETTGAVARKAEQQKIEQNEKLFPKTLAKVQADIDKLVSGGKVDEQQAEFLKERARLYPREVANDTTRALAAKVSAGKPSATEALFTQTTEAMAKDEGITIEAARSRLGLEHFGKSSATSAVVQAANEFEKAWKEENPRAAEESEADYTKKVGAAKRKFMETKKKGNYNEGLAKFLGENALLIRTPEDEAKYQRIFEKAWSAEEPGTKPATKPRRESVSEAEIKAEATRRGVTADALRRALEAQGIKVTK